MTKQVWHYIPSFWESEPNVLHTEPNFIHVCIPKEDHLSYSALTHWCLFCGVCECSLCANGATKCGHPLHYVGCPKEGAAPEALRATWYYGYQSFKYLSADNLEESEANIYYGVGTFLLGFWRAFSAKHFRLSFYLGEDDPT